MSWLTEPVRLRVYAFLVVVVGYLVWKGVVDQETANYILAGVALVLGIVAGEAARSAVTPNAKVLALVPDLDNPTRVVAGEASTLPDGSLVKPANAPEAVTPKAA